MAKTARDSMTPIPKIHDALNAARLLALLAWERLETGLVFLPTRPELRADPYPFYRSLRERDPFHRSRAADGWVLSRYDDCLEVLGDRSFSSDERNLRQWPRLARRRRRLDLPDFYEDGTASLLRMDPPDHTRLRNLVNKAFTPRSVEALRGRVEALVDELLAPVAGRSQMELIEAFAAPLPVVVIAEMLGVPAADRERFRHWSDEVVRQLGDSSPDDERRAHRARNELCEYLADICDARRDAPRDDLISALVAVEDEGDTLGRQELLSILVLLLVAGNETTTKLIANAVVALTESREQLERLRAEPKRISGAVDELLRYAGPVQLTSRIVLADRELRGHRLRKGQQLVLLLAGANRDPARYADPERLDVGRENVRPLAFGHGAHFCLGAQLARMEAVLALEALVTRFAGLRVAGPIRWGDNTVLRGPVSLPLAW